MIDEQRIGRIADRGGEVDLLFVERRIQQQLGQADDAVHRRPQLMAHVGEKFALGAVGRFRRYFGLLQLRARLALGRRHAIERLRQHVQFSRCLPRADPFWKLAVALAALQLRRQFPQRLVTDRDVVSVNSSASSTPQTPTFTRMLTQPAVKSRTARIERSQHHQLKPGAQARVLNRQHQKCLTVAPDLAFRSGVRGIRNAARFQAMPRWRAASWLRERAHSAAGPSRRPNDSGSSRTWRPVSDRQSARHRWRWAWKSVHTARRRFASPKFGKARLVQESWEAARANPFVRAPKSTAASVRPFQSVTAKRS